MINRSLFMTGVATILLACGIYHLALYMPALDTKPMWQIHLHTGSWFMLPATLLHYAGKAVVAAPLTTIVAAVLLYRRRVRTACFISLATLLPTLIMYAVKAWIARPRPTLWQPLIAESNYSFPSGHSTFAAALAVIIIVCSKNLPYRHLICVFALLLMLLTGFSRLYLGVHYPSDVLVGWLNGAFGAWLVYRLLYQKETL